MKRCLILSPYPFRQPLHGGQVRSAAIANGLMDAGWQVISCGIYPAAFFPPEQRGLDDIVLDDALAQAAFDNILFGDLLVARAAAQDELVVARLRRLLLRVQPDVVHLEQPWAWLPLRLALGNREQPAIVYSSQNIEWRMRPEMYRLGLRRPGADAMVAATRALELEVSRRADLVISISDIEGEEIARESGREVVYVPPISDVADESTHAPSRFAEEALAWGVRYAALLSSAYWPNLEGFLEMFPEGLGFLRADEHIWIGGQLGGAIAADPRYQAFQTLNDTRMRQMGRVTNAEKAQFLRGARCVLVPVRMGAGSKLKTADALASGRPVISTSHGLEGYGPLVTKALGRGIYVADTPHEFRVLVRRALREGLSGCDEELRASLRQERLSATIGPIYDGLLTRETMRDDGTVASPAPIATH